MRRAPGVEAYEAGLPVHAHAHFARVHYQYVARIQSLPVLAQRRAHQVGRQQFTRAVYAGDGRRIDAAGQLVQVRLKAPEFGVQRILQRFQHRQGQAEHACASQVPFA